MLVGGGIAPGPHSVLSSAGSYKAQNPSACGHKSNKMSVAKLALPLVELCRALCSMVAPGHVSVECSRVWPTSASLSLSLWFGWGVHMLVDGSQKTASSLLRQELFLLSSFEMVAVELDWVGVGGQLQGSYAG